MRQSQLPSKIYIWIPKKYKRFENTSISKIPDFLTNHPLVQIEVIDKDWGPASKLLPCLQNILNPEEKIIVIDDDILYYKDMIKDLVSYSNKNPKDAVTTVGTNIINGAKEKQKYLPTPRSVDIMFGSWGYLVKPSFFSSDIFEYPSSLPEAFFEDDVWICGHLKKNEIKKIMLPFHTGKKRGFNLTIDERRSRGLCQFENKNGENMSKTWQYFLNP